MSESIDKIVIYMEDRIVRHIHKPLGVKIDVEIREYGSEVEEILIYFPDFADNDPDLIKKDSRGNQYIVKYPEEKASE